jgi:hypothetical protein
MPMLFNKKIEPSCAYCLHGNAIGEGQVACLKKGITDADSSCKKFSYDPLKRTPEPPQKLKKSDFSEEDFIL